eukprot:UN05867
MTSIWTGAIYNDRSLKNIGFQGEGICDKQYKVIAVKAHPEHFRSKFNDFQNFLTPCFNHRSRHHNKWNYTTAIFIVRDPWKSLFAMYNFKQGHRKKSRSRHTHLVERKNWNISKFKKMINIDKGRGNSIFRLLDLYKKYNFKHIVVKFETFFSNESDASLAEMNKIAKFIYNDE